MADTVTLNVRLDADIKQEFCKFCDEIGLSASSLMNIFARTVVKNQSVPFPLTTKPLANDSRDYSRLFPKDENELLASIERAYEAPLEECRSQDSMAKLIKERMGW